MPHNLSEVHWGTVYGPEAGEADLTQHPESGALVLMDQRQGARPMPGLDLMRSIFSVSPKTGRLVIFPG